LLSLYCEDSESPPEPNGSDDLPIDSSLVPIFVNEWAAVTLDNGNLETPGTSTVTPEGTVLASAGIGFHEYDISGNKIGFWALVIDGDTLGTAHIRFRYGKYYSFAYSHTEQSLRLLVYDATRTLIRNTPAKQSGPSVPFASQDVDAAGNVYQLAYDDELVIKYDPSGVYEREWLTHGSSPIGNSWPGGIAVSASGTVYVSDTLHDRILVFDSDGDLLDEWGSEGSGPGQFRWPTGLDSDRWGLIYVTDRVNYRIQKFAPDGKYLGEFRSFVPPVNDDTTPQGVAIGDHDAFVVHVSPLIRRFHFDR
jgi:hypothetical protein